MSGPWKAKEQRSRASVFAVPPWMDVEELGWASMVITVIDPARAKLQANELASLHLVRQGVFCHFPTLGGRRLGTGHEDTRPSSGAWRGCGRNHGRRARRWNQYSDPDILRKKIDVLVAAVVGDPGSVEEAVRAGVGKPVTLRVGGTLAPAYATPVGVTGKVKLISDGEFGYKGRVCTGRMVKMGRAVVLAIGRIRLLISQRPVPTTDSELYLSHGIEPAGQESWCWSCLQWVFVPSTNPSLVPSSS